MVPDDHLRSSNGQSPDHLHRTPSQFGQPFGLKYRTFTLYDAVTQCTGYVTRTAQGKAASLPPPPRGPTTPAKAKGGGSSCAGPGFSGPRSGQRRCQNKTKRLRIYRFSEILHKVYKFVSVDDFNKLHESKHR